MLYIMERITTGEYDPDRLVSLGNNHWSLDFRGAYTYLNTKTGFTYNWENPNTKYKNGIDGHVDWRASLFLSDTLNIGAFGYFFPSIDR